MQPFKNWLSLARPTVAAAAALHCPLQAGESNVHQENLAIQVRRIALDALNITGIAGQMQPPSSCCTSSATLRLASTSTEGIPPTHMLQHHSGRHKHSLVA